MNTFGRLVPKDRSYEDVYPFTKAVAMTAKTVERILPLPGLKTFYNQKTEGACVGFAASWQMSIYNTLQKYDARWLYRMAQTYDKDPNTVPGQDTGTYVWAAYWVLQHLGHKKLTESIPDMKDGLLSYYWGKNTDNGRTAIALGRPFNIGVNWYENFSTPVIYNGEWWIGRATDLGRVAGGHAICVFGASDKRHAFKLVNSWGNLYPQVWMSYNVFDRLMTENGEMVVGVDKLNVT
jgi:hypothetical protein